MKIRLFFLSLLLAFSFVSCTKEPTTITLPEEEVITPPADSTSTTDPSSAVNNFGTILLNTEKVSDGYTLFTSHKKTFLIDNCGSMIHEWDSAYLPGKSVYLLADGSILRAGEIKNPDMPYAGIGGIVEIINWDNEVTWSSQFSSETTTQHHDIFPMPNGNILVLLAEKKTLDEAIALGRNPELLTEESLYNEYIIEVKPIGTTATEEVWKWSYWDHLTQNYDSSKDNYEPTITNPHLLDINFLSQETNADSDWLHVNSIQYNESLDQILISAQGINEIHIIDHSTTTLEAQTDTGGQAGKGGGFLYRYGNPEAYGQGDATDVTLFRQHFPNWILETNKIMLFNNGNGRPDGAYSTVDIITPPITATGDYMLTNGRFGPANPEWTYIDPTDPTNFYSRILSSAQPLPNGNTLICEGLTGRFFEVNQAKETVWQYISPVQTSGDLLKDSQTPEGNLTFRAIKYPKNHSGFDGKDVNPKGPIELEPVEDNCQN